MALPPPLLHGGGTLLTGRRARGRVFFTASPPPPLARQPLEFYTSGSRHAGRRAHRRAPFLAAGSWRQKSITKASRAAPSCVAFASPSGEHQPPGKCQAKPSGGVAKLPCWAQHGHRPPGSPCRLPLCVRRVSSRAVLPAAATLFSAAAVVVDLRSGNCKSKGLAWVLY